MFAVAPVYAQPLNVSGVVTDEAGDPVIGASVVVQGTTTGVMTGINGEYDIVAVDANATLVFSFVGLGTLEEPLNGRARIDVVLNNSTQVIDEVVVIGYGTVKKKDMTGSVSAVRAEDMNRGAVTSAQEMLMGKIPGVFVTPGDGGPGSSSTIRIRGGASLNASNDPLIVIDGVPISNDAAPGMPNALALVNPNDIESFTVLKDASATAIYGSRASNGVLIITTKKGSGKGLTLSYNSTYSVSVNSNRVATMSPGEYRAFMLDHYAEGTSYGDRVRGLMGTANTDWQDKIFRPAFSFEENVSAYGQTSTSFMKLPYRVSLGYNDEKGTLKTSDVRKGTLSVNLSPSFLNDHLKVSVNANGIGSWNDYADGGTVGMAAYFDPTHGERWDDGSDIANGYFNWFTDADRTNPNKVSGQTNPMSMLNDQYDRSNGYRLLGNVALDYKLHWLPELRFNLNLGLDKYTGSKKSGNEVGSFQAIKDDDNRGIGKYHKEEQRRSNDLIEFYANYANNFGNHRVDVMAGYSWQHFYTSNDGIDYMNQTDELWYDAPKWATENYLVSFFGRANYSYDGRYLATFSLRDDASSRFSKENRWGLFPAAALAWHISEEGFLKNNNTLSDLKLRLGWGLTGQQELNNGDYPYLARYNLSSLPQTQYPLGDGNFYPVLKPDAYDENIHWETTETYNIGLDLGFLRGRIAGAIDLYYRKTYDLLNTVDVPLGSNFSNVVTTNVGNMENKGVELSVNATVLQGKDYDWNVGVNVTYQHTEITNLTVSDVPSYFVSVGSAGWGTGANVQLYKVGYTPYAFYTFQQVYDVGGKPIENALVDRNGDGVINNSDRYISGKKPTPDVFLGLNTKFRYKNWDFGFNAHANFGNWMYNSTYAQNATTSRADGFLEQGILQNLSSLITKTGFTGALTDQQKLSDFFLEDASFFRMDDITLGYTFDNIAKTKLKLRTSFTVQNVFVITGYSGLDPEVSGGIDNGMWPRPRIFALRLGLTF
jgi:iron complex outermembrane receptor protein